ncbi:MAG: hypothetical protein H6981_03395 [Gammaproteobacteria bacterium]|nr:hypothetical protein [Gammaproteobacteria bacterium]MCP5135834.1 hypothetical protein [Gammaproteobacteria bacterium]
MKSYQLPYLATPLGLLLMLVIMVGGQHTAPDTTVLPLLTLLMICEFAFFVTGAAAFLGIRHIRSTGFKPVYAAFTGMCALLALRFLMLGLGFWPNL